MKSYRDVFKCPQGHKRVIQRRLSTAGRHTLTYCTVCRCSYDVVAGQPKTNRIVVKHFRIVTPESKCPHCGQALHPKREI